MFSVVHWGNYWCIFNISKHDNSFKLKSMVSVYMPSLCLIIYFGTLLRKSFILFIFNVFGYFSCVYIYVPRPVCGVHSDQ